MNSESYFDGGILGYIGYSILGAIICAFTLGIGTPWAVCMMQNWKTKHTVIDGKRLYFDGTGAQLYRGHIKNYRRSGSLI